MLGGQLLLFSEAASAIISKLLGLLVNEDYLRGITVGSSFARGLVQPTAVDVIFFFHRIMLGEQLLLLSEAASVVISHKQSSLWLSLLVNEDYLCGITVGSSFACMTCPIPMLLGMLQPQKSVA